MCTTPVARTVNAPRHRAVRAIADRRCAVRPPARAEGMFWGLVLTVAPWLSLLGHEARNGSFQRGGLVVPECAWGRGDNNCACSRAGHEAGDLAVGGSRGRVVVDDACAAPGVKGQVV